jgi:hypothetical protein
VYENGVVVVVSGWMDGTAWVSGRGRMWWRRAPDTAEIIYFTNLDKIKVAPLPFHSLVRPSPQFLPTPSLVLLRTRVNRVDKHQARPHDEGVLANYFLSPFPFALCPFTVVTFLGQPGIYCGMGVHSSIWGRNKEEAPFFKLPDQN